MKFTHIKERIIIHMCTKFKKNITTQNCAMTVAKSNVAIIIARRCVMICSIFLKFLKALTPDLIRPKYYSNQMINKCAAVV